jgi:hypothetical protein
MKRIAYYALAGQIRLLMDAPEALWSAVETKENLLAAEMYLLARQVYHGTSINRVFLFFPVQKFRNTKLLVNVIMG